MQPEASKRYKNKNPERLNPTRPRAQQKVNAHTLDTQNLKDRTVDPEQKLLETLLKLLHNT